MLNRPAPQHDLAACERHHDRLVSVVFGQHLAHAAIVRPEHPERHMSLAPIRPAKVRDLVPDLDVARLPDELSTHTADLTPASPIMAARDLAGCDSPWIMSTETNLCLVAPAQRIGIAA